MTSHVELERSILQLAPAHLFTTLAEIIAEVVSLSSLCPSDFS